MDERLVAWARAVKARRRGRGGAPTLWLFTDELRLTDPVAAVRRLPPGLCGVVLRDDAHPDRRALGESLAALCRQRRLVLSVAGDWRLAAALGAGLHLRGGRRPCGAPRHLPALTASAHGVADLVRARRAGAAMVFLSPIFATASHRGVVALGPLRWGLAARRCRGAAALGGIDGRSVWRLPRLLCHGCGAIGALRSVG
jgi:thiamine-phosphate pyrophosphorylase